MYNGVLPAIFQAYRLQHSNVELEIIPLPSVEQCKEVREGRLDVGFVYTLPENEPLLSSDLVFEDNFVLALNQSNPLTKQPRLRLEQLMEQSFVWFSRSASPRYHDEILSACQRSGFIPNAVQIAPYIGGTALTLVSAGVGVSFVQESSAILMKPANVVLRPIEDLNVKVRCSVVWKADRCPRILESFLDVVRQIRAVSSGDPASLVEDAQATGRVPSCVGRVADICSKRPSA